MRKTKIFFRSLAAALAVSVAAVFTAIFYADINLADDYFIVEGTQLSLNCQVPITMVEDDRAPEATSSVSANAVQNEYGVNFKLLGIFPVGSARVNVINSQAVKILGTPFGIKLYTDGVLVVKTEAVDGENGDVNPAADAGIKLGDTIKTIDGVSVSSNEDVADIIEQSGGRELTVVIERENVIKTVKIKPKMSKKSGTYRIGIWVRDSTAGIGTLTFYSPANGIICGLGHGLCDDDTDKLMSVGYGEMVGSEIVSVIKGKSGTPGELKGKLTSELFGELVENNITGVYARSNAGFESGQLVNVAMKQEINDGPACIYATVDGKTTECYTCEVEVRKNHRSDSTHNLIVTITDDRLLELTGGIVQGLSGSPLLQNGKLIGAVTHVLVDDPTKGYAIYAENMLETAQLVSEQQLKEAS